MNYNRPKVLSVHRTSYHKVVMHYVEKPEGVQIVNVTPDVGPLPDISQLKTKTFIDVAKARTELRNAMKNKFGRDVSSIRTKPSDWAKFVLALDDYLVQVDLGLDDVLDDLDGSLRVCQYYGDNKDVCLVSKLEYGGIPFEHCLGKIDWSTYTLS